MSEAQKNELLEQLLREREAPAAPAPAAGLGFGRRKTRQEPPQPLGVLVPITARAADGGEAVCHLMFGPEAASDEALEAILDELGDRVKSWKKSSSSGPGDRGGSRYSDRDRDDRRGSSNYRR